MAEVPADATTAEAPVVWRCLQKPSQKRVYQPTSAELRRAREPTVREPTVREPTVREPTIRGGRPTARVPSERTPSTRVPSVSARAPSVRLGVGKVDTAGEACTEQSSMPREKAEALAMQWQDARSAKDYATADAVRSQLRAVGVEAEELVAELRRSRVPAALPPPSTATARQPRAPAGTGAEARGSREAMPRKQAEALAMEWRSARSARDYTTADGIRSRLRAVGIEAEELADEIEMFGISDRSPEPVDVSEPAGAAAPPAEDDPLGYKEHMTAEAKALFKPTDAAARHKDGGTGGLLTIDYSLIPELPSELGFTVTAGKLHASETALSAYKQMKQEEEEAQRREVAERNSRNVRAVRT